MLGKKSNSSNKKCSNNSKKILRVLLVLGQNLILVVINGKKNYNKCIRKCHQRHAPNAGNDLSLS